MPSIEPYSDKDMPERFMRWLETLRATLRSIPGYIEDAGTPEAVVTAEKGTRYFDLAGPPFLYVKSTDGGDTGWIAYDVAGGGGGGSELVRKVSTGQELFSSTTLTDHTELSDFALDTGRQYLIHGLLYMEGQFSSGQLKLSYGFSNAPVGGQVLQSVSYGSSQISDIRNALTTIGNLSHTHNNVKNGERCFVDLDALVTANVTDGGTYALRVAQAVINANPVAVNAGSWIEVDPLN